MSGEITGIGPRPMHTAEARGQSAGSGETNVSPLHKRDGPTDSVQITDSATKLKALEARISDMPQVDSKRVEALRAAISEGRFHIDSVEVAEKLVEFETALAESNET